MLEAIKVALSIAIVLLLLYPFVFFKGKIGVLFPSRRLRYEAPEHRKNVVFIFVAIAEIVALVFLFKLFDKLSEFLYSVPFIARLLKSTVGALNSQVDYILLAIKVIIVNLIAVYGFLFLKSFIKKLFIDFPARVKEVGLLRAIFGRRKRRKKKKNTEGDEEEPEEQVKKKRRRRIPFFEHTRLQDAKKTGSDSNDDNNSDESEKKKDKAPHGKVATWFLSLFYEGEDFEYARGWVFRTRAILTLFVRIILVIYLLFFTTVILSCFFRMPKAFYSFLMDTFRMGDWYLYPFMSVLLLREVCNCFDLPIMDHKLAARANREEEEISDIKRNARIRKLLGEIKKRFDTEHYLRYYPEVESDEVPEYECTSVMYKSALDYIKNLMKDSSGHVVQSYMELLDAVYNDEHTYFSASFYSEIGEYLIAYTYIRLMSGARQVFVVSNPKEKETLRTYISDRLMKMTGSSPGATWRVYTAEERLEQADILIATPEDFVVDDIAERHPAFFEEVCNAIFIDADKIISLDSYLCPIMATRLKNATGGKIRFVFLSLNLLKGFAAGSLPRFFCVDKVLSFSSAKENESSSCVLWNKESKKHRIYNKSGQKSACLETIIAEQACLHGVDGVRLITESPIEHAERNILARHNVEINNFYKDVVDVNYMIYSDDKCNLSAALYACMRFRGRKKSVVHILSKPYMLREYFASKAITEDHINRSSFIQPRVTEHVDRHKLSLVRIFCDATFETGISVTSFEERVKAVIRAAIERKDDITSAFCKNIIKNRNIDDLRLADLAAYLVAGICDNDNYTTEEEMKACIDSSRGKKAKNFYIIVDSSKNNGFATYTERSIIFNRVKEIFNYLLACNRRVELRLNDEVIGKLDTFPTRVHLEYVEGQSLIYNNSEYEIDHITADGTAIYLRQENISIKNCLDTIILRHYSLGELEKVGESAVLDNSQSILEEIRVTKYCGELNATTFGFYSLTSDRQTIDFYRGVEGNLNFDKPKQRNYKNGKVLHVSLKSRGECNDGMRRLLAAVFNEFIKTLFPGAYHCVAIVPVLSESMSLDVGDKNGDPIVRIKTLYPFFNSPSENYIESESNRIQFYIINDCREDVGILDWFYDHSARYMQEFLANIYSYLYWLKLRPDSNHYIYFGGKELPKCYDLDGLCELLGELNLILSDSGERDIETAGDDLVEDKLEYCSFCHKLMENGRYTFFDDHRLICSECFDIVTEKERLESVYAQVQNYLAEHYPEFIFPNANVDFDDIYNLEENQNLSENYYRVDFNTKTIYVELDEPVNNVFVSILRGIIAMWQVDNELANHYGPAQLYFEEMKYLRSLGEGVSADWIHENIPDHIRAFVDEIDDFINGNSDNEIANEDEEARDNEADGSDENDERGKKTETPSGRSSFAFMRVKREELARDDWDGQDPEDDDFSNNLFDPNKIPRFWKKLLRGENPDDGQEEDNSDAEIEGGEDDELDSAEDGTDGIDNTDGEDGSGEGEGDELTPNAPPPGDDDMEFLSDESDEEDDTPSNDEPVLNDKELAKQEKQRKKEEKKRQREEKRRQKQLEWERKMDALDEEENKQRRMFGEDPVDYDKKKKSSKDSDDGASGEEKKEKRSLFGRKKKKTEAPVEEESEEKLDSTEDGTNDTDGTEPVEDTTDTTEDTTGDDDLSDEIAEDDTDLGDGEDDEKKSKKSEKKPKQKKQKKQKTVKRAPGKKGKLTEGERIVPYEEDEDTNPKIRLYNELVRAAYNYSEEPVSRAGVSDKEMETVFRYICHDYPELFWVGAYSYTPDAVSHRFRCRDANGNLDLAQIKKKHKELRQAAAFFTKGISKKTDPYKALLKIYRKVILTLDYDGVGLNKRIDKDMSRDDALRSLYSALVSHKVVCAGYAVAMQYLLQSVGITCAYVVSESVSDGSCHAFNIVKIGKYLYYLDATWGDSSNTLTGNAYKDLVKYDYFCVPYHEFIRASGGQDTFHRPRKEYYPNFNAETKYSNHEYHRYHKAYITTYNENEIARIFSEAALRYDKDEMGCFTVNIRCCDKNFLACVKDQLWSKGGIFSIIERAKAATAKKNKKAAKLLERKITGGCFNDEAGTMTVVFETPPSKKQKKEKK